MSRSLNLQLMKTTDDLYQLVRSLSQAEKRYVKVFASKHLVGSNNNYIRLFDALAGMEEYNESELKAKFKGKTFIKHLPSEKNYLHKFILKSMRSFHAESSVNTQLKELLLDAQYLFEKRLYNQCVKVLEKAKRIAVIHDKYYVLFEIYILERDIVIERETKDVEVQIEEINKATELFFRQAQDYFELYRIKDSLFIHTRKYYHLRDEQTLGKLDKIMQLPLLAEAPSEGFEMIYFYNFSFALYHSFYGRHKEVDKHYLKLIDLWEAHPERIKEESHRYKKTLSNYLSNCQALGKLDEFPRILERIRSIPSRTADEEAEEFQNVYYMELLYLMNTRSLDKAEQLLPEIEKGMKQYRTKINKARELAFYHNIAVLLLVLGKYKASLEWVNKIVNDERSESRQDIQDFARVFQVLLHYEMGNADLVDYIWRSAHRYFRQKEVDYTFELLVLNYLKKLAKTDEEKKQDVFSAFEKELNELVSGPLSRKAQGFDEISYWVKSKVMNKALAELVAGTA